MKHAHASQIIIGGLEKNTQSKHTKQTHKAYISNVARFQMSTTNRTKNGPLTTKKRELLSSLFM